MSNFRNLQPNPQIPGHPQVPGQPPVPPVAPTDPAAALDPLQQQLRPPQLAQNPTDPNLPTQGFGGNLRPDLGRTGGAPPPPGQQYPHQPQAPVRGRFDDVHPDMGGNFPLAGGRPGAVPGGNGGGLDGSWVGPGSSLFHGGGRHGPPQGQLPPGVPPGARFDPIGPGGRPLSGTPPLPRGGNMPLFRGEPDNDLERPPPDDDFGYQQRPDVRAANALMYGVPAVTGDTTAALAGGRLANPVTQPGQGQPPQPLPQPRQAGSKGFDYGW